jgi:GNAT superfamily N-acetyltransferase
MPDAQLTDIMTLLNRVWPGFARVHDQAARSGLRWDLCSTPFVHRAAGRVVSHVGVLELPLVVAGRALRAAGIHAVATDPEHRGRGHMRRLMEEALRFVDRRYDCAVLTAGSAELYRPFGFEVVQEYRFVGPASSRGPENRPEPARDLDPGSPPDLALLHRLLRDRAPVSRLLGVTREMSVFLFDTAGRRLRYAPGLDAILYYEVTRSVLCLYDVVAERIPSLAEIASCVPDAFDRVEVQFSPDQLQADLKPEPWLFDGEEILMARGPFLDGAARAALPRTARC